MVAVAGAIAAVVAAALRQPVWAALAVLAGAGIGVCRVDLAERRIPTPLVAIGATGTALATLITAALDEDAGLLVVVAGGAVLLGGVYLVVHLAAPTGVGFGDVRLAAFTGAAVTLGAGTVVATLVAGFASAVAALVVMGLTRRRTVPFGPFLVAASLAVVAAALVGVEW